jgi:2-hydroxychromene-2-carboxylate isomerase
VAVPHNPHFPINTLALMRTAVAAQQEGVFTPFHAAVYPAFWAKGENLGSAEVLAAVLADAGLDAAALARRAETGAVKEELRATTEEAVARGAFGAPSIFFAGELYFGVDHLLFFLDRALSENAG